MEQSTATQCASQHVGEALVQGPAPAGSGCSTSANYISLMAVETCSLTDLRRGHAQSTDLIVESVRSGMQKEHVLNWGTCTRTHGDAIVRYPALVG
jgi:hypothetical protein